MGIAFTGISGFAASSQSINFATYSCALAAPAMTTIVGWCTWTDNNGLVPLSSVSDGVNSAILIPAQRDSFISDNQSLALFVIPRAASGTTTVTMTIGSAQPFLQMGAVVLTGVDGVAPVDVTAGQFLSAGTGTDAVTTGNLTTTRQFDTLVGVCGCFTGATPTFTAGTGFSTLLSLPTSGTGPTLLEMRQVTTVAATAATFTQSTANSLCASAVALFAWASGPRTFVL